MQTRPFWLQLAQSHTPRVFDDAVLNSIGHYDSTTGIYKAPIDGTYEFIIHILSYNDFDIRTYLVVDGTRVSIKEDEDIL